MKQLTFLTRRATFLLFLTAGISCYSQSILGRNISLEVNRQRLDNVLEILSNKGNFYFSYNSSIIKNDSLVTLTAYNKTVKQVLDFLFNDNYEYKESGNYIIIRRAPVKLSLITNKTVTEDKIYTVSGYVLDDASGEKVSNVSIYEKRLLASSLTNDDGYFKIRLKSKSKTAELTVSKEFYQDTTVVIQPRYNQQVTITIIPIVQGGELTTISPGDYFIPDSIKLQVETDSAISEYLYVKTDSIKVEKTAAGRFFLSPAQRIQSLNLKKFFTQRPFQVSLTPGLSSHGKLNAQVVNNFSFNVFGGYSGGVNGFELGGLFNIDKKNVQYAQIAGLFNVVGGHVNGLQIAGLHNTVLDTVQGFQIAGINNLVKGKFTGFQLGGIYNHVSDSVKGFQLAGIANFAKQKMSGAQIAGIANVSNKKIDGVQISGIFNYAKKLGGVQIGLINVADTSDGYGIGLINIVFKGYHKLSFSTNEVLNTNVAFKTGNSKLYNILQAGMNAHSGNKIYSFGYGMGSELSLGKIFSINPELTSQYLYLGSWDHLNLLNKAHLNLNIRAGRYVSFFAGPSLAVYYSNQTNAVSGYKFSVPPSAYHTFNMGNKVNGWFGWNAGINFF